MRIILSLLLLVQPVVGQITPISKSGGSVIFPPTMVVGNDPKSLATGSVFTSSGSVVIQSTSTTNTHTILRILNASGTELFRSQQNGVFGINTTSPGTTFTVTPTASGEGFCVRESDDGNDAVCLTATAARGLFQLKNANTVTVQAGGGSENAYFNGGGNLGVGNATPVARVHVSSAASGSNIGLLIDGDPATSFRIGTSSLIVTSGGNLGVGTASPGNTVTIVPGAAGDGIVLRESDNGNDAMLLSANTVRSILQMSNAGTITLQLGGGSENIYFNGGGTVIHATTTADGKLGGYQTGFITPSVGAAGDRYSLIASSPIYIQSSNASAAIVRWDAFLSAANERLWDATATGTTLSIRAINDAASASEDAIKITRSGATITKTEVPSGLFVPRVATKATIDGITGIVGAIIVCSDCTVPYDICMGTGTALSGFRAVLNSAINTAVPGTLVNKGCGSNN